MITKKRIKTVLTLAAAIAIVVTATHPISAAELTHGETVELSDNHSVFNVSVFPGKAGYDNGTVSGVFGNGTVTDYRFFDNTGTTFNGTGYVDGGAGLFSEATATNSNATNGGALHWADVWTTSDPDVDAANFTAGTVARSQGVAGTIDISGISKGTLYFIYGTFRDLNAVSLTMSGPGQPDVLAEHTEDPADDTNNKGWISSFDISDAGAYDTISYSYSNADTDASRARFMGVIVCATDPMNPSPTDGATISAGEVELSWTNMDPNSNDPVYVDVWFGTDPNDETGVNFTKVVTAGVDGENRTSVTVPAPMVDGLPTAYYWQVISYLEGGPTGDPNEGSVYTFFAADLPPSSVDAGPDMIAWSGGQVQLAATVEDDGLSGLTYAWSADAPDGIAVEFDPPTADTADPAVTITKVPSNVIPVVNASFEDPVLAEDDWTWVDVPGWTQVGSDSIGVWNVTTADFDPVLAPDGENVAYTEYAPDGSVNGLGQVLTQSFTADTGYTLTVDVGNSWAYYWSGYSVQLLAGGTVIAEDDNTIWTDYMLWGTSTVEYTSDPAHSDLVGQPLEIRLLNLGLDMDVAAPDVVGVEFDNVRLTADTLFPPAPGMVTVELTLAVGDGANDPLEDTMTIDVYDDACKAAIGAGLDPIEPTDLDGNCITNLADFAVLALDWLDDYALTEPVPLP